MPLKPFFATEQSKNSPMNMKKVLRPKGNIVSKLQVKNFLKLCIKRSISRKKTKLQNHAPMQKNGRMLARTEVTSLNKKYSLG